jgi:hypothetical protein
MILSRIIAGAALVTIVFGCGDRNNNPPPGTDTSQAGSAFTGAFGDSAKPDTTRPSAPTGTNTTGNGGGNTPVGTTDTEAVTPGNVGTTDTVTAGAGGRVDPRVYRPTPGVYDTAPAPMMLQKKRSGVAQKAGVHR